jgi:ADP-dependent NAD(P)H-hydrate dehydratase / NAD(P)H-hydrate epimerase
MTVILTPDEMRAAEAAAAASGITEHQLMRLASERIAAWVDAHLVRGTMRTAIGLVGPGNNGGDALVTLGLLAGRGWRVAAVLLGREQLGELPIEPELLRLVSIVDSSSLPDADIILDGVYGIGSRASLPADTALAFEHARYVRKSRQTPLVAIDVPSGVDALTGAASEGAFQADVTLCLGYPKTGLLREPAASRVGELVILPLGISAEATERKPRLVDVSDVQRILGPRNASAHKSTEGTVLIVAGAPQYYGAPRLAAEAALRAGAGLVALATPTALVPTIAAQVPEIVFIPLPDRTHAAQQVLQAFMRDRRSTLRAVVIGPGMGRDEHATSILRTLLQDNDVKSLPLVADADALNWLSTQSGWWRILAGQNAVLTPHVGEMARLTEKAVADILTDPISAARELAQRSGQHILLKTGYAPLASPDGAVVVGPRATPELATAGTGDVLAGLIGGLAAQGLSIEEAATAALWIGCAAGQLARAKLGTRGVVARDVIESIPHAVARITEARISL